MLWHNKGDKAIKEKPSVLMAKYQVKLRFFALGKLFLQNWKQNLKKERCV